MNYTFLVVIAACLIGCGSSGPPYTQEDLNNYCKECLKDSSSGAVTFHPYRCDAYLNCQILTNGFLAHVMPCPVGSSYDNDSQNCIPNQACSRACTVGEMFAHVTDCEKYFVCKTGTFTTHAVYESCPASHKFDVTQQKCVPDDTCNPLTDCPHIYCGKNEFEYIENRNGTITVVVCTNGLVFRKEKCGCTQPDSCAHLEEAEKEYQYYEITKTLKNCTKGYVFRKEDCGCIKLPTCSDNHNMSSEPGKYLLLDHNTWVTMLCAPGTSFNLTTCGCTDLVPINGGDGCTKINVTLEYDVKDVHKSFVDNKGVSIVNKMGYFDGVSYFVLARTANVKLVTVVDIRLSFKLTGTQKGDKVALLGNARCGVSGTVEIYIKGALGSNPKLVVDMVVGASQITETLETNVSFDTWYTVKVVKTDSAATLYLNGSQTDSLASAGQLVKSHCAIAVGNMTNMATFNGYMEKVFVSWCPK